MKRRARPASSSIESWIAVLCFVVGAGAVGGPLVRTFLGLGVTRFSLSDPSTFEDRDVGAECGPEEVGEPKAAVLAERLARRGAIAVSAPAPSLERSPEASDPAADGSSGPRIIVLAEASREERREAHRYAHQNRIALFEVQIDPAGARFALSASRYDLEPPPAASAATRCPLCRSNEQVFAASAVSVAEHRTLVEAAVASVALMIAAALRGSPAAIEDGEAVIVHPASQTSTRITAWKACRCSLDPGARAHPPLPRRRLPSRSAAPPKKGPPSPEA